MFFNLERVVYEIQWNPDQMRKIFIHQKLVNATNNLFMYMATTLYCINPSFRHISRNI